MMSFKYAAFYAALSLALLLPSVFSAPSPDTIFLLKESSFISLGCSTTFSPASILHQVSSPSACFSRCSSTEIAAYTQVQYGVLCSCGSDMMLAGIESMDVCEGTTWYLYSNNEVEKSEDVEDDSTIVGDLVSAFSRKGGVEKSKRPGPMPMAMLNRLTLQDKRFV